MLFLSIPSIVRWSVNALADTRTSAVNPEIRGRTDPAVWKGCGGIHAVDGRRVQWSMCDVIDDITWKRIRPHAAGFNPLRLAL